MLSMGVGHVFVCNRTISTAYALADHYNRLIEEDVIKDARTSDGTKARVRVIERFTDAWPQDFSLPTMVVCTIPSQKPDGSAPSNFTVPAGWLQNPTGGVAVEVSCRGKDHDEVGLTDNRTALIQSHGHSVCAADASRSEARLDTHGRLRSPPRAGFCSIRAFHRPSCTAKADARCRARPLPQSTEQARSRWARACAAILCGLNINTEATRNGGCVYPMQRHYHSSHLLLLYSGWSSHLSSRQSGIISVYQPPAYHQSDQLATSLADSCLP